MPFLHFLAFVTYIEFDPETPFMLEYRGNANKGGII